MKKKIIYGLLLAVAMVTASSSFVSCKDYEGDDYANSRDAIAQNGYYDKLSLEKIIELQIKRLRYELTNAYGNSNNGNYSNADIDNWLNQLNTIEGTYKSASSIDDLINVLRSLNQLASEAAVVNESLKNIRYAWGDSLKKAYDKAFEAYWFAYRDSIRIDTLSNRVDSLHKNALDSARYYYVLAQEFAKKQDSIVLDSLNNVADRIYKRIQEHSDSLKNLEQALNDSCNDIRAWVEQLLTGKGSIRTPKLDDQGNPMYDDQGNPIYEEKQIDVTNMQELLDALSDAVLSAQGVSEELKKDFEEALKQAKEDLQNEFNTSLNDAKIDLQNMFNEAVGKLQDQLDDLEKRVAKLEENFDKLKNTLAKQITGVIIQGTYSPVLGNGSLPLGIQTNLLAAYAGKATKEVDFFPSVYDEDYADGSTVLTVGDQTYLQGKGFWPAGFEALAKGDYIISDREDNAGKLYLTVNPTNVNFEGTTFDMVNSAGQVSRMELSDLKPCKDVLNFGWTRGGATASTNGFYVANAKVTKENIVKLSANINTKKFEEAFKEQLNSKGTGLVSYAAAMDLARAVYSSLEPLQRNGIRATWLDEAAGMERSYTSAYDIAATVVSPLGFGFKIPDSKYTRLPVYDTNYLKNKFHIKGDFSLQVIDDKKTGEKHIALDVEEGFLEGTLVYQYGSYYYVLGDESYLILASNAGYVQLDITSLYQEIYGDFETALTPYKDVVAQANKRIDYVVNYIDRYNRYATKVNNFIANANNLLQPVLLWCDGQNVGQLGGMISGNYAVGTVVPAGGAVALVPTTYTLELLAPAFKKSVICTNVYKNGKSAQGLGGELEDALKAVNNALKAGKFDLYEGQDLKNAFIFDAKSDYEGMTFEFAYTALDYAGKIAGRKFYLTVGAAE